MTLESIEKLRKLAVDINAREIVDHMELYPSCVFDGHWLDAWHREFDRLLEDIQAEVGERYMLLPVDADGVPIHCGERMKLDNGHEGEVWLIGAQDIMMSDHTCFDWAKSRHAKPDAVRELLLDFYGDTHGITAEERDELVDEYAERIRGAVSAE